LFVPIRIGFHSYSIVFSSVQNIRTFEAESSSLKANDLICIFVPSNSDDQH
jgi:hypothetical protein